MNRKLKRYLISVPDVTLFDFRSRRHIGRAGAISRFVRGNHLRTLPSDPRESATVAGLRYVTCASPGFRRRRSGNGFAYYDRQGALIRDREALRRIRSLALPPAWRDVWICSLANGHLQATGVDARGRRQYRYHPEYRRVRNHTKFNRLLDFADALPGVRQQVNKDLGRHGLPREKVLATVVRLLETTFIRIGNEEYAKGRIPRSDSPLCGIAIVTFEGSTLRFRFRGKSGQMKDVTLQDRRLARIVRDCRRDLPGYELFPVCRRFRRSPFRRFFRRERLSAQRHQRRLFSKRLSYLGRYNSGGSNAGGDRARPQ